MDISVGGFGSKVLELLNNKGIKDVSLKILGYPNQFIEQGDINELEKKYGLDDDGIERKCLEIING